MFLLLTDIHFTHNNADEVYECLMEAVQFCFDNHIETIIISGDIFTERDSQKLGVLLRFRNWLKQATEHGIISVYLISGNHDKTNQDSEESYLDMYSDIQNVNVFRKEQFITVSQEFGIAFLPYFRESSGEYAKRLKKLVDDLAIITPIQRKWILITHVAVNGVKNNDGSVVSNGIPKDDFNFFDKVLVGHYHDKSEFNNIYYIGSLRPNNYGENNNKGYTVIDSSGNLTFIKGTKFKKFIKIKFDCSDKKFHKKLKVFTNKYSDSEDNIRFVFSGTDDELAMIDKNFYLDKGIDVKKENVNLVRNMSFAEDNTTVTFNKNLILEKFKIYCDNRDDISKLMYIKGKLLLKNAL